MSNIKFKAILKEDIKGKKILMRVDINSSIDLDTMQIRSDPRIRALIPTLNQLKDAAVVLIAHQSRKGKPDFTDLNIHADQLNKYLNGRVKYVKDLFGDVAIAAIKTLEPGKILLLNNVRIWEPETKVKSIKEAENTELIEKLSPLFDYFVHDAFGAAHRAQVSLIGWPKIWAGPTVEKELDMVKKLFSPEKPSVWLVGGAKAIDKFKAINHNLEAGTIDKVLLSGLTAILMMEASGIDTGEANRKYIEEDLEKNREEIKAVCEQYKERLLFPVDFAYEENGERKEATVEEVVLLGKSTGDIGTKTIEIYNEHLRNAKTIVANGPPGIFEKEVFKKSSFAVLEAMAEAGRNDGLVCIGGGEMGSVAQMSEFSEDVTISTGGGALLAILSGKDVPLLEVLREKYPE
jgi:phosphoglycerate kinase